MTNPSPVGRTARPDGALVDLARRFLRMRGDRPKTFGPDLFADPAWEMLLYLFVASAEVREVDLEAVCTISDIPPATALRWVRHLEQRALVERYGRSPGTPDRHIRLSADAMLGMRELLSAWQDA